MALEGCLRPQTYPPITSGSRNSVRPAMLRHWLEAAQARILVSPVLGSFPRAEGGLRIEARSRWSLSSQEGSGAGGTAGL